MKKYYLFDCNATTEEYGEVKRLKALLGDYSFVNISNDVSKISRKINKTLEDAKERFAKILGIDAGKFIITSGASESNATIFKFLTQKFASGTIISSTIEHKSILCALKDYEGKYKVKLVEPNKDGVITRKIIEEALTEDTFLVSIMTANNETGFINDFVGIGELCSGRGICFHSDATQYIGKNIDIVKHVNSFSMSFHKLGGPKGVGLLYYDKLCKDLKGLIYGTQQDGVRGGTVNFVDIIPAFLAFDITHLNRWNKNKVLKIKKDFIKRGLKKINSSIYFYEYENSLDNTIFLSLGNTATSEDVARFLDSMGILVGFGSACNTSKGSHVVESFKELDMNYKKNIIRISFDDRTSSDDCKKLLRGFNQYPFI